jgi:hypothetical protein
MRYKTIGKDCDIDAETAILQAAGAADAAGVCAEKLNDTEGLLNVANFWLKIGEAIVQYSNAVNEESVKHIAKFETGFQKQPVLTIVEEFSDE